MSGRRWTPAEDAAILAARPINRKACRAGTSEIEAVARKLGRTVSAVRSRRAKLTGPDYRRGQWTPAEDERVLAAEAVPGAESRWHRDGPTPLQLAAEELGRTYQAVVMRRMKLRKVRG